MNSCAKNCLIVLVEDDELIRSAFSEVLQLEGYEVLAFANGREAMIGLHSQERAPCLILLDWMMPQMNGEEFLEARSGCSDSGLKRSPVVVVSAEVSRALQRAAGVAELIDKPVDLDRLLNVVSLHCRRPAAISA
ncbi:MAG TPA: response regulator [Bdellovibrionota bacterium]|jgi:two-component system response regulator MprA